MPALVRLLLATLLLCCCCVLSLAESEDDCLNVEDPKAAAAAGRHGDNECFGGDELGMVCGWDGTPEEAYCELAASGLKVCARRRGGGRCKEGNNSPPTDKTSDQEPAADSEL
eukprot:CAMPEP_0204593710 /NCGR_PEP_ID=MMETSP0661-20131031/51666_1 /ASSEMBLY_ACC=CAM_ASM_000606 /TAXON_ID=109239 /ORGANISM="Alexandrium margalefi, Strain AMGDE01CS-322" /LENGTH=112 /DNA_ID=CAMNT_0051604043 /DNA_START=60 /DNA_END=398 /DNA_ORIENTATION=-